MSSPDQSFSGIWLHKGETHGQNFSHSEAQYDHADESEEGKTQMRHAHVERDGGKVGVWVPQHWTDEQVTEALETNW